MRAQEVTDAREKIGHRWGLGRALTCGELGHLLRLKPDNAWDTVNKWEEGRREISGPVSVAIEMMVAGCDPPTKAEALKPNAAWNSPRNVEAPEMPAERLRSARERAGFETARAAALHHGWPPSTYTAHEGGHNRIGLSDAGRYGQAFDVRPSWLLGAIDE